MEAHRKAHSPCWLRCAEHGTAHRICMLVLWRTGPPLGCLTSLRSNPFLPAAVAEARGYSLRAARLHWRRYAALLPGVAQQGARLGGRLVPACAQVVHGPNLRCLTAVNSNLQQLSCTALLTAGHCDPAPNLQAYAHPCRSWPRRGTRASLPSQPHSGAPLAWPACCPFAHRSLVEVQLQLFGQYQP